MKKVIYYLVTIFIVIVIFINIFSFLNISLFGFRIFKVASGSMIPYLNVGDVILIKKSDNYKKGDVVTYKESKKAYVTHRIVSINNKKVITRGDTNNVDDEAINKEMILGKVIYRFRYIPLVLSKPITWCLLFVIGTLFIVVFPMKREKEK